VEFDPLNVPEDLREEQSSVRTDCMSAVASPEPSCAGSEVPTKALSRQSSHGIMLALPEKLRMHAEHAQHLADNALNSFVIINTALQRSAALAQYVQRKDVQARMGSAFRVGMGFGLHAGCDSLGMWLLCLDRSHCMSLFDTLYKHMRLTRLTLQLCWCGIWCIQTRRIGQNGNLWLGFTT